MRPATAAGSLAGAGGPPPIPTDCPAAGVAAAGAGPASSFGLGNVLSEARSLVSHSAVVGATKYCLYRKTATTAYRLVGSGPGPDAGVITDGGSPTRNDDYEFRTDALTATGVVAGSNSLNARGATVIPGVTGWAGLNQTCATCGACERRAPCSSSCRLQRRAGGRGGLDRGLRAPARAKSGRRVVCPPIESADTGRRRIRQRQSHHLRSAPGDRPRWRGRLGAGTAVHQRRAAAVSRAAVYRGPGQRQQREPDHGVGRPASFEGSPDALITNVVSDRRPAAGQASTRFVSRRTAIPTTTVPPDGSPDDILLVPARAISRRPDHRLALAARAGAAGDRLSSPASIRSTSAGSRAATSSRTSAARCRLRRPRRRRS